MQPFPNPFTTAPGQTPPYLAGRTAEQDTFRNLLRQKPIMKNAIVTGLRGIGKTVLLESLKSIAMAEGWLWVGTDWSEGASVSETTLATRVLADIALQTSAMVVREDAQMSFGFAGTERIIRRSLDFDVLTAKYNETPGLSADKLKAVIEFVWSFMPSAVPGIVFAYDEAQTLADHAAKEQYPMSVLIETFQSLQRKGLPTLLVLTGLPTLLAKLSEARTYTERMFEVMTLKSLSPEESRDAIVQPTLKPGCPLQFSGETVTAILKMSAGYPYFIQFICREVFDAWIAMIGKGEIPSAPTTEIVRKLDNNFFQSRWNRATDRQKELMMVIATLPNCDVEFTVADVVGASKEVLALGKHFKPSNANIMLAALVNHELVYKNRFGKYILAVPLLSQFILRQTKEAAIRPN
jgi:hypothetical protein